MKKLPVIHVVNSRRTKEGEYIGRPSILGNPYSHLEKTPEDYRVSNREEAVHTFQLLLESHLRTKTPAILQELDRLAYIALRDGELTLRCWCAPKACHGDVIKKFILDAIKANYPDLKE